MRDLGINRIADLKHKKISSHGSPFSPAGPSGPWAKMETLGRKFFMLTVCNSIYALVTHAEITHFSTKNQCEKWVECKLNKAFLHFFCHF